MSDVMHDEMFPWNENFATGIEQIDVQHKQLVHLLNELASHLAIGSDRLELDRVLDALTDYTIYHFSSEEQIWQKYVPQDSLYDAHLHTHQAFIDRINFFRSQHDRLEDDTIATEILNYLAQWLAFHILDTDRYMAELTMAIEDGMSLAEAKTHAEKRMSGTTHLLVETVLKMYNMLSRRTLSLYKEIHARKRIEQQLHLSKKAIDSSLESIFITDQAGILLEANPALCKNVGKPLEQLLGRNIQEIKPSLFKQTPFETIHRQASKQGEWVGEVISVSDDGRRESAWLSLAAVHDETGEITHFTGVLSTASQILERQHSLEVAATHDLLTGLPNRRLLHDRLRHAIQLNSRKQSMLAVCFLDLDGFKQVNDSYGHDAGDCVLMTVAERLKALLRRIDTIARMGGDEFVFLLSELNQLSDINQLLQRILSDLQRPIPLPGEGAQAYISGSIGVAIYRGDQQQGDDRLAAVLLKRADQAMYAAKDAGKSQFKLWEGDEGL